MLLADAVEAADALLDAHRVPRAGRSSRSRWQNWRLSPSLPTSVDRSTSAPPSANACDRAHRARPAACRRPGRRARSRRARGARSRKPQRGAKTREDDGGSARGVPAREAARDAFSDATARRSELGRASEGVANGRRSPSSAASRSSVASHRARAAAGLLQQQGQQAPVCGRRCPASGARRRAPRTAPPRRPPAGPGSVRAKRGGSCTPESARVLRTMTSASRCAVSSARAAADALAVRPGEAAQEGRAPAESPGRSRLTRL